MYNAAQVPKAGLPSKSGYQVTGIFDNGDSTTFKPALVFDHLLSKQNLFCYYLSVATCHSVAHLTEEFGSVLSATAHPLSS